MLPNIHEELNKFNHIEYYDEPHIYKINGERIETSGTGFVHLYTNEFDSKKYAPGSAKKAGCSVDEILAQWAFVNKFSTIKGTLVHNFNENLWWNKVFPYNPMLAHQASFTQEEEANLIERYTALTLMSRKFYNDTKDSLIPIVSELVIGDQSLPIYDPITEELIKMGVCGMVDKIFWSKRKQCYLIGDWKTNKEIQYVSKYGKKMKGKLSFMQDCNYEHYCLQLNLYKFIIERMTNIKIGGMFLVWLFEENESYQVINCTDYQDVVRGLFKL